MAQTSQKFQSFFQDLLGTGKPIETKKKEPSLGKPIATNKFIIQKMSGGAEEMYFWMLNFIRHKNALDYEIVEKISDIFSASESSSFFGNIEQRKSVQQDRISQFLATVGQMTKSMFQMIRELRVIDERLDYYKKSMGGEDDRDVEAAEIALKGIWVDLVEGGAENAGSVYGLARKVGFVILPDLFFKVHPKKSEDIDRIVDRLKEEGINRKVREVLKRKLFQYSLNKVQINELLKKLKLKSINFVDNTLSLENITTGRVITHYMFHPEGQTQTVRLELKSATPLIIDVINGHDPNNPTITKEDYVSISPKFSSEKEKLALAQRLFNLYRGK